jgi:hypothetical protein
MQGRLLLLVATLVGGAVLLTSERAQASKGEANCYYHAHTPQSGFISVRIWRRVCMIPSAVGVRSMPTATASTFRWRP